MNIKMSLGSKKTTAIGIIALLIAVLQVVSGILSAGIESVNWGEVVPLLLAGVMGLFAKDGDKADPPASAS